MLTRPSAAPQRRGQPGTHRGRAARVPRRRLGSRVALAALPLLASLAASPSLSSLAISTARAEEARSDAAPRARVHVLIVQDPSTDWGRRVRGQLSDLPASAEIRPAATLAGHVVSEDAAPARSRRATSGPALTAWLTTGSDAAASEGNGTFIAIWFRGAAQPYARRIAADWSTLSAGDRSAALELAALSVRSAVRSLLLDPAAEHAPTMQSTASEADADVTTADAATADVTTADAATADVTTADVATADAATPDVTTADVTAELGTTPLASAFPVRLGLELGAAWQFYGRTALGAPGARAGVLLLGGAWGLEVMGQYGWPVSASVGSASFELQRHAALAELSVVAAELGAWRFCPLLRAGLTWLRRDDTRAAEGDGPLQASGARNHRSPFVGVGAIAERRLSAAVSLTLRGVLNVETAIPTFTLVDTAGAPVSSGSPWAVQPSIEVGASWR